MTATLGFLRLLRWGRLLLWPGLNFLSLSSRSPLSPMRSYTWTRKLGLIKKLKLSYLITVDDIAQTLEHGAPPFNQLLTELNF